jgi:hypothetical protein
MTDLASAGDIATLRVTMPAIEIEVAAMKSHVSVKAYTAIRQGDMTPDLALALWHEHNAANQLLSRFASKLKGAQAAGKRVEAVLTGPMGRG